MVASLWQICTLTQVWAGELSLKTNKHQTNNKSPLLLEKKIHLIPKPSIRSQSDTSRVKPWTYKQHLCTLHGKECNLTIQFTHSSITSFCYSWCFEILWPKMRSLCWVLSMVCAPSVHSPAALFLGTPWCSLMGWCQCSHRGFGSRCSRLKEGKGRGGGAWGNIHAHLSTRGT